MEQAGTLLLPGGCVMATDELMIREFLELVRIDSVSGQERRVADLLKEKLTRMGLAVEEDSAGQKVGSETGNIIGYLPANGGAGPVLMLCAHMDTVEPGRGVEPRIDGGIIRSSGETILGADDKAGIVIILEALRRLQENGIKHGGIDVVFTVWEEGGLFGAKYLDYNLVRAKTAYVLDGGGPPGTIITRAPSQDKIGATVRGRAAHAGISPEDGINAIQVASVAIAGMKIGRIDDETTSNIGLISGGKAVNIVPESATIQGETRSLDTSKRAEETRKMCDALRKAAAEFGATVETNAETIYESFSLEPSSFVVSAASEAALSLGLEPRLVKTGGGSDANIFNSRGIQSAVLGIGWSKVHTTEESIAIDSMPASARYLVEIIMAAQG